MNQQASGGNIVDLRDFDEMTLADRKDAVLKDTELEILGQLLLKDGLVIPTVKSVVQSSDFLYTEHKILYQTILNLYGRKITPNMLTIAEELRRTGELDKVGYGLVLSLGEVAFTTAYAETHAQTIKQRSNRRKLFREIQRFTAQSRKLAAMLLDPKISTDSVLDTAKQLFKLETNTGIKKGISQSDFLKNDFKRLSAITRKYSARSTGFSNIDRNQIFAPAVISIGATPACGKTTFCWQLLNQLAQYGEKCLFCSYEMSAHELTSKTLARRLFLRDKNSALSSAQIRCCEASNPTLEQIFQELCEEKSNLEIFELTDETIDDLFRLLEPYCVDTKNAPTICLDYLQILPASDKDKGIDKKTHIENLMRKIKVFQRETNTTWLVVSSLNRQAYANKTLKTLAPSMADFKESGAIEYSSDIIFSLSRHKDENEVEDEYPRKIQLTCLKNRQGNLYSCYFNYYSGSDYFEEVDSFELERVTDHTCDDEPPLDDDEPPLLKPS